MRLLEGKQLAAELKEEVKAAVKELVEVHKTVPGLAVILVGDDPASAVYVKHKENALKIAGIASFPFRLPAATTEADLLKLIDSLNARPDVHGILVQIPLPAAIDPFHVIRRIHPNKDVDGLHPVNLGALLSGHNRLVPCTPRGVIELLRRNHLEIAGKHCVIIGRSTIVGRPLAQLFLQENATVTVCHSQTKGLGELTRQADILVAAAGKPGLVTATMVKPWAVVVDVGITRSPEGALRGDVDFTNVKDIATAITPVPGGVGPMTIAMLMRNTVKAAKYQLGLAE